MQFLKTLFWVILAIVLMLFALANWTMVTVNLWGGLQADVKLPVLVVTAFLIGFLPTLILYRARIWSLRRRIETLTQTQVANGPVPIRTASSPSVAERMATDSKAWPAE
jgi:putative membrane protein